MITNDLQNRIHLGDREAFLAVYQVLGELLKHAADLSQANAKFMLSWAGYGIIGLLIGYALMYVGGMLGHTAAYRTLYGVRVRLAERLSRGRAGQRSGQAGRQSGKMFTAPPALEQASLGSPVRVAKFDAHQETVKL